LKGLRALLPRALFADDVEGAQVRIFFLLLIFINLIFFAWGQGYFGDAPLAGREPERVSAQIASSKLRIVSTAKPVAAPESCRMVGNLKLTDAQQLQSSLSAQLSGVTIALSRSSEPQAWEVSITGLANRNAAVTKLTELKKFGVTDARIVDAADGTVAVVLATFPSESAAQERLQNLTKKGVKSAKVSGPQAPDIARLIVHGPDPLLARLPELTRSNAGATLADCPPP
jgi:hypothetical protein